MFSSYVGPTVDNVTQLRAWLRRRAAVIAVATVILIAGGAYVGSKLFAAYKYNLAVLHGTDFACGATLMAQRWALTAAHCVSDADGVWDPARLQIAAGSSNWTKSKIRSGVTAIYVNIGYDLNGGANDIALLRLSTPIKLKTLKVPAANAALPTSAVLSGWGTDDDSLLKASAKLRWVTLNVKPWTDCGLTANDPLRFCAGTPSMRACYWDSGSPLAASGDVVGVVSRAVANDKCGAKAKYPTIYSTVSAFSKWIEDCIDTDGATCKAKS